MQLERLLPGLTNEAAPLEASLLRRCFDSTDTDLGAIFGQIRESHFFDSRHRQIFGAARQAWSDGSRVDSASVLAVLEDGSKLRYAGGRDYLAKLLSEPPARLALESHLSAFLRYARRRQGQMLAVELDQAMAGGSGSIKAQCDAFAARLAEIGASQGGVETVSLEEALAQSEFECANGIKRKGITTGFRNLDASINGLHRGYITVIGGRPGKGKSAFAQAIVLNAAIFANARVLVVSLEMTAVDMATRAAGYVGALRQQDKIDADWDSAKPRYAAARRELGGAMQRIHYTENRQMDASDIAALARRMKATGGLDIVVVDYLQLMKATGGRSEVEDLALASKALNQLAADLDVAVVALAQLNREVERRSDPRPYKSDLKGSGQIEQDAASVLLLWKPYDDGREVQNRVMCAADKARFAPEGSVIEFGWRGATMQFWEI